MILRAVPAPEIVPKSPGAEINICRSYLEVVVVEVVVVKVWVMMMGLLVVLPWQPGLGSACNIATIHKKSQKIDIRPVSVKRFPKI